MCSVERSSLSSALTSKLERIIDSSFVASNWIMVVEVFMADVFLAIGIGHTEILEAVRKSRERDQ